MKEKILQGTMNVFRQKGIKFTMDDLAADLGMSKKTIYTVFSDKESLLIELVDYVFDTIKESESVVMADTTLDTTDKLRRILSVMPETYMGMDFGQLHMIRGKYPKAYERIEQRLESGWEQTIELIDQGVAEGVFRPVNKLVFQLTFEAALERFLTGDELMENKVKYLDALQDLANLLVDGVTL